MLLIISRALLGPAPTFAVTPRLRCKWRVVAGLRHAVVVAITCEHTAGRQRSKHAGWRVNSAEPLPIPAPDSDRSALEPGALPTQHPSPVGVVCTAADRTKFGRVDGACTRHEGPPAAGGPGTGALRADGGSGTARLGRDAGPPPRRGQSPRGGGGGCVPHLRLRPEKAPGACGGPTGSHGRARSGACASPRRPEDKGASRPAHFPGGLPSSPSQPRALSPACPGLARRRPSRRPCVRRPRGSPLLSAAPSRQAGQPLTLGEEQQEDEAAQTSPRRRPVPLSPSLAWGGAWRGPRPLIGRRGRGAAPPLGRGAVWREGARGGEGAAGSCWKSGGGAGAQAV